MFGLFKTKTREIWEETERKLVRTEIDQDDPQYGGGNTLYVYAVFYKDLISGKTKIEERHSHWKS